MLGHKARAFRQLTAVSLEDLIPEDNFYRLLEEHLDLRFIHEFVSNFYSEIGRPSIDPVVFFKLQLIAFFEGIRSERQLMETVNLNLAHRWYIGYDLVEVVPDHSSLSKIRERYGLEVFHQFFEHIVELCIGAGLVWGEELFFDSTKVRANADIDAMVNKVELKANQHLEQLFPQDQDEKLKSVSPIGELVSKYNGNRITGLRKPSYQRIADERISQTEAYQKAIRKRSVWVEPLFGEAKQFHRLRRFRLRGLKKVNIEGVMVAAGQNIKRLINHWSFFSFSVHDCLSILLPHSAYFFNNLAL